jgi:hypothetical protein
LGKIGQMLLLVPLLVKRIGGISHATTQIHIFLATRRSVSNDGRQVRRARSTPSMPACTALVPQNAIHVTVLVRMAGK